MMVDCTGELKGIMTMRDATHGYFQENGDPCVIDFIFGSNNITVKETRQLRKSQRH
jgi:hypothetical protein